MAIQFVVCATGQSGATFAINVNITIPSNPNQILLIKAGTTKPNADTVNVTSVTVSGFAATLKCRNSCYPAAYPQCQKDQSLWYLCNPPTGAVVVTVNWDRNVAVSYMVICEVFSGVDLANPFDPASGCYTACGQNGTSPTITFPSAPSWLPNDFVIRCDEAWMAACAGQTITCRVRDDRSSPYDGSMGASYEPGAVSVTMCWTDVTNWGVIATSLLPYVETIGRRADYFFDAWDPEQRVVDGMDRELQPWEIEPDHWMRITGLILPTAHVYETFDQDPEMAYIESVAWQEEGDSVTINIETNRGDLPDIILRRAAQGSVGG